MSNTPEVKPALTPKEWEEFRRQPSVPANEKVSLYGPPHWTAAICLYGQPFGFTHEDLRLLAEVSESANSVYSLELNDDQVSRLGSLIARIAALLPPDTP